MSNSECDKNRSILESGIIEISIPVEPVSSQANIKKKDVLTSAIHKITNTFTFILTGDVKVDIQWLIHEQKRYESDSSADVDNILKPILDALSGSKGVLIDDCQVQTISCHWIDWTLDEQEVKITIQMFFNDEWLLKDGLVFVHMGKALCLPIYLKGKKPEHMLKNLDMLEEVFLERNKLLAEGADYYYVRSAMPIQRVFHISRVKKEFEVIELADFKSKLLNESQKGGH